MLKSLKRAAAIMISVGAFSTALAQGDTDAKPPALTVADLEKAAQAVRSSRPTGVFVVPPKEVLPSRFFRIELPVMQSGSNKSQCLGQPVWSYYAETEEMLMDMTGSGYADGSIYRVTIPISCVEQKLGDYSVENLFGVRTNIDKRAQKVIALTLLSSALKHRTGELISSKIKVAPIEAKALTENLRLRVEGELRELSPGRVVHCGTEKTRVDMKTIWDVTSDYCRFGAHVVSMAFVDERSGEVVANDVDPIQALIDAGKCSMSNGKPTVCSF